MKSKYNWVEILNGELAIGGRPSMQLIAKLHDGNCATIVTLLRESEQKIANEIGEKVQSIGMNWIWLPLSAADLPQNDQALAKVLATMQHIKEKLAHGERIFIHCAAGIHRTGAFTYGLLRYLGNSAEIAKDIILKLRPIILQQALPIHWQWGEQFAQDYHHAIIYKKENKCIFCSIIKHELPASIVYEDEEILAIMDIQPINMGHVLVMPKTCYPLLHQVPTSIAQKLFSTVAKIEKALWQTEDVICEGTNILQNNGRTAWQDIDHVHFHIIPRFAGDGFKIKYQPKHPEREALEQIANKISVKLNP